MVPANLSDKGPAKQRLVVKGSATAASVERGCQRMGGRDGAFRVRVSVTATSADRAVRCVQSQAPWMSPSPGSRRHQVSARACSSTAWPWFLILSSQLVSVSQL